MIRTACLLLFAVAGGGLFQVSAGDGHVVFRSDVSLVRVDAQVVNQDNRTITGLQARDFVLRDEGHPQAITNFASENMPVDVLLLLDVSASMRPHVQRIASAAHEALRVLGDQDRVAIMVFDRSTRLRLSFRSNREDVERELESLLDHESFNGGTDITRALFDAADYVAREGRPDARRAIVIVTDDQTERNRDVEGVSRALTKANAVLCALLAPDAMRYRTGWPGSGRAPSDGPWPGGPPLGGPLGGIIFGRRGPYGGRGPVMRGPRTQSAGTAEIARRSGGDSMSVDDASALETTLARIRQRYALYFHLPEGVKPGEQRTVEVALADAVRQRYPGAQVRYRHDYYVPNGAVDKGGPSSEPTVITKAPSEAPARSSEPATETVGQDVRRQPAVSQGQVGSSEGPLVIGDDTTSTKAQPQTSPAPQGGWRQTDQPAAKSSSSTNGTTDQQTHQGGWRRLKPGEQP